MAKQRRDKQFKYDSESYASIVAERGQVTIPKKLRDKLGLLPGSAVNWVQKDNKIYLTKENTQDLKARIEKVSGILKKAFPYASTDDFINDIRGAVE